jgi:hypothetical protein
MGHRHARHLALPGQMVLICCEAAYGSRGTVREMGQRMKTISATIQVNASPAAVWAVLTDLDRYAEWNPLFPAASGEVATGKTIRLRIVSPANGRLMTIKPKVVVARPGVELRWAAGLPGLISGEHHFTLSESDGGTRLDQGETFRGLLVAVSGKMLARAEVSYQGLNEAVKVRASATATGRSPRGV